MATIAATPPGADPALAVSTPLRIVIPVFNDWESLAPLLTELDEVLAQAQLEARVLVVDDASTEPLRAEVPSTPHLGTVECLRLARNLGHQRAIAVGLTYVAQHQPCEAVVVMDGDGEDGPADVPRLVERLRREGGTRVVFAERSRRAEGLTFRAFYHLFRLLHWLATGRGVRFGNFSAIPAALLPTLTVVAELWNHYAASVVKARLPYCTLPTARRPRLRGRSKMAFVGLVIHGLSALSVFSELVATRALLGAAALTGLCVAAIAAAVWVRLYTELAIPGWATNVVAFFVVILLQALTACSVLVFFTLQARTSLGFLPVRDHHYFIKDLRPLAERHD